MSAAALSDVTMQRLAFARYVYRMGVDQSRLPEPANAVAVLLLHDAADLFLQVAADHAGAQPGPKQPRAPEMTGYFDLIDPKLPDDRRLTQRLAMGRLHETRNVLKHRGVRPSSTDLEAIRAGVTAFFDENVERVFGIRFDEVSMTLLVAAPEAREHLTRAEQLAAAGDYSAAVEASATAYAYLRRTYGVEEAGRTSDPFTLAELRQAQNYDLRRLATYVERLTATVSRLEEQVTLLSLGVEPARMERFVRLTPDVEIAMAGNPIATTWGGPPAVTQDDARFCYELVVGVALTLQRRESPQGSWD